MSEKKTPFELYTLLCPECESPVLEIRDLEFAVPEKQKPYWIDDGDTLPVNLPKEDLDFFYAHGGASLLVGNCKSCHEDYFVIELVLANKEVDRNSAFYRDYIIDEPEDDPVEISPIFAYQDLDKSYIVSSWFRSVYYAEGHIVHRDIILLNISDDDAKGEFGMSACTGLGGVWDKASEFIANNFDILVKNRVFEHNLA